MFYGEESETLFHVRRDARRWVWRGEARWQSKVILQGAARREVTTISSSISLESNQVVDWRVGLFIKWHLLLQQETPQWVYAFQAPFGE